MSDQSRPRVVVGGWSLVKIGDSGIVAPPKNPVKLADALRKMLDRGRRVEASWVRQLASRS